MAYISGADKRDVALMVPLLTKERGPDGSLYVYGRCTDDRLDHEQQIVDLAWAKGALQDWFKSAANIRQMHSGNLPPAGKGIRLDARDDGVWLRSKIVEPGACRLVESGTY